MGDSLSPCSLRTHLSEVRTHSDPDVTAALFHKNQLQIFSVTKGRKMLVQILMKNGLYCVKHDGDVDIVVVTIEKLHCLMGHIAPEAAKALVNKGLVEGIKLDQSSKMLDVCSSCEYGKAHRKAVRKKCEAPRAVKIGDEIHSNVWGPSPVQTIGRQEYYSTYIDNNSRYLKLYLQKLKSQIYYAYKRYEAYLLWQKGVWIKKLHTDWGGEYLSNAFNEHLAEAGTI